MTRIIVLTSGAEAPQKVGIIPSQGLTTEQARDMCLAAAQHFTEQAIEEEVQRRLELARGENCEKEIGSG